MLAVLTGLILLTCPTLAALLVALTVIGAPLFVLIGMIASML